MTEVLDANEAVASVAFRLNEVIAIYPITPASPMGEHADDWAAHQRRNCWGDIPTIVEMQSEGGAAGAVHGALQAGALTTTFTASQGLLLMLPNMYKIAGELTPFVMHVAARSVATHALSIFCDHSDVMACRGTGFGLLCSASVQQAQDFACIAQAVSLASRLPFLHFFDGFRTSHELNEVDVLTDEALRSMVPDELLKPHRERALTPDRPSVRGTAQNPDTFFQAREAVNAFYAEAPAHFERALAKFSDLTGRRYQLFEYTGHPQAERVLIVMGSAGRTAAETANVLAERGERVGVVEVHLYRPFSAEHLVRALPASVANVAVLDRTKEPGAVGEPLYLDVVAALSRAFSGEQPRVIRGRYGLSSKEFTPSMVRAVFDELGRPEPRQEFTVGIVDDVTGLSLAVGPSWEIPDDSRYQAVFFGLGSDGTVGANKNTIRIVSEESSRHVQGYFVYDSKKAGAMTTSHLRFSERAIEAPYLVDQADFVACHQFEFLSRLPIVERAKPGAVLLINSPFGPERLMSELPVEVVSQIIDKKLRVHVVDAYRVARDAGLGRRINTVMQTCFFALAGVVAQERALLAIKRSIEHSYARKGAELVRRNNAAVDAALAQLFPVELPERPPGQYRFPPTVPGDAPAFVQRVTATMLAGRGDSLPVSAFPVDGTFMSGTSRFEKRNLAAEIPEWDPAVCIQCNKCALACPHAAIRAKVYEPGRLTGAPAGFQATPWKAGELKGQSYTLQVAPEDCTGCRLCVEVCPAKDKANPRHKALEMVEQRPRRDAERERYAFFLSLPEVDRTLVQLDVKGSQLLQPLFEYSGACAGCGETPYVKLVTQLFGDRLLIANATGCSSIYGGNLPTTPYATNAEGRGPAWSNSLFEDNAEFGFGMRLAVDHQTERARRLVQDLSERLGALADELLAADQSHERGIVEQRQRVALLQQRLAELGSVDARSLAAIADYLVKKSVWLIGGDGWAYDIGYGGLDHVLASERDVNVLVLDTEVYSNTGGQQSKATPLGAAAKFASAGKSTPKKDLGLLAMSYGHVYVAHIAFGAKDAQTVRALAEADAHPGPSLVIAYSHCIAHGYDLAHGAEQQRLAVESAVWPLYRFDPRRADAGEPPLSLDSGPAKHTVREYMRNEMRFRMVEKMDPKRFEALLLAAEESTRRRVRVYEQLSHITLTDSAPKKAGGGSPGAAE